ncbi:MAG: pyridoxamine 5'-phosphate oxidase family protein [Pseudomonadota bacterium]
MAKAYYEVLFTDTVRALQKEQGTETLYADAMRQHAPTDNRLGPVEKRFIGQRDGFYQSTVSQSGWPYVQFRGGPRGFLKVLDPQTLGYADYRGNRQYISDGNIAADDRMALILVDYPNSARLKVLARARLSDDPDLIAQLSDPEYRAKPERAVILNVEAFDWNCPQHLPVRLTMEELEPILAPFQKELSQLRAENAALREKLGDPG